jgi:hypothetical protein
MAWSSAALNLSDALELLGEAVLAITAVLFYSALRRIYPRCNFIGL